MTTKDYIEAAKQRLNVQSDYGLSKHLGLSKQALSGYMRGTRTMDDYTAAKIAEVLNINALEVIAAANAEREKDSAKVAFWRRLATNGKAASLASVLIVGGFLADSGALDNLQSIHYAHLLPLATFAAIMVGLLYKWRINHAKKRPF